MTGFVGPNANHITLTPGSSGTGSGTGFMGFGPTGFTTPIDTVLDRFGRTGTIFPTSTITSTHNPSNMGKHLLFDFIILKLSKLMHFTDLYF